MNKLNNVSLNFNLREPRAKRATQLYCVVRVDGKQHKIPLHIKIQPWLWDNKKQIPILLNEDKSTLQVFNIILDLRLLFWEKCLYLCNVRELNLINEIKNFINMKKVQNLRPGDGRKPRATTLLAKAFNIYYAEKPTKESTVKIQHRRLDFFCKYCQEIGQDKMSMLSRSGLNAFRDYLVRERDKQNKHKCSNKTINEKCEIIERLINLMAGHSAFDRYNIQPVKYRPLPEVRTTGENKMRQPLTNNELKAIKECSTLTPREEEYRDLFLAQCECGCRVSDLWKIFDTSQQKHYTRDGEEVFVISTLKENIDAVIVVTPLIKAMQTKYSNGFKFAKMKSDCFNWTYNENIRRICRKAELVTPVRYMDARGTMQTKPLCEVITSHYARYTFINEAIKHKHYDPTKLKYMTGHASEKMINQVYSIISAKDKANDVLYTLEHIGMEQTQQTTNKIAEYRDVLAHYGEPRVNYINLDEEGLLRLIVTKYEIPLNRKGWKTQDLKKIYNNTDVDLSNKFRQDLPKVEANQ